MGVNGVPNPGRYRGLGGKKIGGGGCLSLVALVVVALVGWWIA